MHYIMCENCGGYYKLQKGESLENFDSCHCGGSLRYVESVHELFNKHKSYVICPKCGRESSGGTFCSYCSAIIDTMESSRNNEYFSFHKLEAKSPKTLFGGRNAKSTDPKDWFIRDRLRVDSNGNYFREEVHSVLDGYKEGGPGLNHSWDPVILIQDIVSGHNNSFIQFLKTKKHLIAGYLFYFISLMVLYLLWKDIGFQLSVAAVLISGMITSFFANKQEYPEIFFDITILAGLCTLTPVIITFLILRYSFIGAFITIPGSELTLIRFVLILALYGGMAIIGGYLGRIFRRN